MAIPHSKANPKLIRSGYPLQSFFANAKPSKKRISTTIPIAIPASSI